jgi:formylglycine-generating enzyme required for sulfatase activity
MPARPSTPVLAVALALAVALSAMFAWKSAVLTRRSARTDRPPDDPAAESRRPGRPPQETVFAGIAFVWVTPGSFLMGSAMSPQDKQTQYGNPAGLYENEQPQHEVTITQGFWIGKYEVTQSQWESVMGSNPSRFVAPDRPVDSVLWAPCQAFLRRLNEAAGQDFRLPTEAEWEYACRAGSTTEFCFGDSPDGLLSYGWHAANSAGQTHPVGTLEPNACGIYDMHGNVGEWCQDFADDRYYDYTPAVDPVGPDYSLNRVWRGGSWGDTASNCRSPYRMAAATDFQGQYTPRFGLRLCKGPLAGEPTPSRLRPSPPPHSNEPASP